MIYTISNRQYIFDRKSIFQLEDISNGKFILGAKKAKRFYKENKSVIDKINQFSNIRVFINSNYAPHSTCYESLEFFYKYILKHKKDINKILDVLNKLNELGFSEIEFDEDLDFSQEKYDAHPSFKANFQITYVANATISPQYENYLYYYSTNTNYRMKLRVIGDEISTPGEITLNSLIFDPNSLPKQVDRENTFDQILKLKNDQKEKSASIRSSVDLSISISDLDAQLTSTTSTINKIEEIKNKEKLLATLLSIKEDVDKLKELSAEHDKSITEKDPSLTEEILKSEKEAYTRRRFLSSIDLC